MPLLRLIIFDLDYTVWQPEMYQLRGPPTLVPVSEKRLAFHKNILKEAACLKKGHILVDRDGSPMRVFPGANLALSEIQEMNQKKRMDIRAAVASRTDEPRWAQICMDHLVLRDGTTTLAQAFGHGHLVEISYGNKVQHIQRLQRKTGIAFEEMCFFDNEYGNIRDVQHGLPAVKCYYTPDGMTEQAWEQAKADFGLS